MLAPHRSRAIRIAALVATSVWSTGCALAPRYDISMTAPHGTISAATTGTEGVGLHPRGVPQDRPSYTIEDEFVDLSRLEHWERSGPPEPSPVATGLVAAFFVGLTLLTISCDGLDCLDYSPMS